MAIKQAITSITGSTTEYHRISEVTIDYQTRKVAMKVLSYLDSTKRDEEKGSASQNFQRDTIMKELEALVINPTPENEARRIELSNQINAMPLQTVEDAAPRNISSDIHEFDLPQDTDFTLEYAYNWLKQNIYTSSEDC